MKISSNVEGTARTLTTKLLAILLLLFIVGGSHLTTAQEARQPEKTTKNSSKADLIAHGRYLVEGVAACGDCHTPRNEDGTLNRSRWLEGAPVFLKPARAEPGWALVAPRLAGLPPGSDTEIITLLTTGVWRGGVLRPPMPHFYMNRRDAESILAYLKSLNSTR